MKRAERTKKQPNGLLEPYTVMIQGRPVVVKASNIDEAIEKAGEVTETTEDGE